MSAFGGKGHRMPHPAFLHTGSDFMSKLLRIKTIPVSGEPIKLLEYVVVRSGAGCYLTAGINDIALLCFTVGLQVGAGIQGNVTLRGLPSRERDLDSYDSGY